MFIEQPASKRSIAHRRLIYGIGLNDSTYTVDYTSEDGERERCPFYSAWLGALERCYSDAYHKRRKTYKNCELCKDWQVFSLFKRWMKAQDWEGNQLDKDIISRGNKIYSPETCCFVDSETNNLISIKKNTNSKLPVGVTTDNRSGKYIAKCNISGKSTHIGSYYTIGCASNAYNKVKSRHIRQKAENYNHNERIYNALLNIANLVEKGKYI